MNSYSEAKLPPKLMYRKPNSDKYQNITEVLDEILERLDAIESVLQNKVIY